MLDDRYFQELGEPSRAKLERLPIWARVYIFSLRADATWWELASRGRTGSRRRAIKEPSQERIAGLPVFASDWIRTLRFEVYWWRTKTFERSQRVSRTDQPACHLPRPYQPSSTSDLGSTVS